MRKSSHKLYLKSQTEAPRSKADEQHQESRAFVQDGEKTQKSLLLFTTVSFTNVILAV